MPTQPGCNCPIVLDFLVKIGARHSARMHKNIGRAWTDQDWLDHFEEERVLLFPRLLALPRGKMIVETLLNQHTVMIAQIRAHKTISKQFLAVHSALEDEAVKALVRMLNKKADRS